MKRLALTAAMFFAASSFAAETNACFLVDPLVQSKRAKVTNTAGGSLQVECTSGCSGSAGSSAVTSDIRDGGILQQQNVDILAQLTLICRDATLIGGTQKAIARGGAKGATVAADVTATANGADHHGLDVQVQNATLACTQSGAWSLSANQSVNVAQVNGATTATAATGVQKNGVVGNAGAAFDAATGAALPANALLHGVREGANIAAWIQCDKSAVVTAAAAANTQIVALSGSTVIYVCGFSVTGGGAAGTMQWKYGTGTACATGAVNLTGAYTTAIGGSIAFGGSTGYVFKTTAGQALCVTMATASAVANGVVTYAQF